jgi:hypothetical protein
MSFHAVQNLLLQQLTPSLAATARFTAGIALQANSVSDHREGAAIAAGVSFIAF